MKQYLYPQKLKAAASLWLQGLRDNRDEKGRGK